MMKCILPLLLLCCPVYSIDSSIGEVVLSRGTFQKTNINFTGSSTVKNGRKILPGDRIKTGKNTLLQIRLKDGTALKILDSSDIIIYSIKLRERDKATKIFAEYGKFKILQNNRYMESSLTVETKNSIIKSVNSHLYLITSRKETGLLVYKGEAGFANSDPSLTKAYIVKQGDEVFIEQMKNPELPSHVKSSYRSSWLSKFSISPDKSNIIKHRENQGLLDWLFQKKDK